MQTAHEQVEELLEDLKLALNSPNRFEAISDQISVLCRGYMAPGADTLADQLNLTPKVETRILNLLQAHLGKTCSRTALMDAVYFDRHDEEPQTKIIDVKVCHLRKKLTAAKSQYEIETVWGQGYRLRSLAMAA